MKNFLAMALTAVAVLAVPSIAVRAEDGASRAETEGMPVAQVGMIVDSGTCGDNLTWTLTDDGVLTISGTGAMENYMGDVPANTGPWRTHESSISRVVIQEGISSIGNGAFNCCTNLSEIQIPEGVTNIGDYAFRKCNSLGGIRIPEGVTSIGNYAFFGCISLEKIQIPKGVTSIGLAAFQDCTSLRNVQILEGVTSIENETFRGCSSLAVIELPESVTSIGDCAFYGCNGLTSIDIPEGVTSIGGFAFYDCGGLTEMIIPGSVSHVMIGAFSRCFSLTDIYFMGSVPAFGSANGNTVFYGVTANVYYPVDNPTWTEDNMLDYGGNLTWIAEGSVDDLTEIPANDLAIVPEITDEVYVIGSADGAVIKCTGELKDFISVAIDGTLLDSSYYTVEEGSTVLTILSVYLDTLAVGDYAVTLNYTYGSVDMVLTVLDNDTGNTGSSGNTGITGGTSNANNSGNPAALSEDNIKTSPKTGDGNGWMLWAAASWVLFAAFFAAYKKQN